MNMNQSNIAIAIFATLMEAESAIKKLQQSSFDMKKLSIVGRSYHSDDHFVGYYKPGNRKKTWGKIGRFWGEIWGSRSGPAFFIIPGFGSLLFAGPIVGWLTGAMEGEMIMGEPSRLEAGLVSMGIPAQSISKCDTSHATDRFAVIAHGTASEVKVAHDIIVTTSPHSIIEQQITNDSNRFVAEEIWWNDYL